MDDLSSVDITAVDLYACLSFSLFDGPRISGCLHFIPSEDCKRNDFLSWPKDFPFGWDLFHVQVMAPGCAFETTLAQQVY